MENFVITISYLILGLCLKGVKGIPRDFSNALNLFVIYISLPALVLLKIPKMSLGVDLLFVALLPWIMVGLAGIAVYILSKILGWSKQITGCLMLMTALGNTSFLGIPMVKAFFGDQAISYAMIYDQLGSFLALATYGSIILAIFGQSETASPSIKGILYKIITFPPFLALVLAFCLRGWSYPGVIERLLTSLGGTLVPVVMIAVGFQLHPRLEPGTLPPLLAGLGIKMIAAPASALFIAKVLGVTGEAVNVAIFEAGMPPMVSAGALAILAGLAPRLTAALVGLGIFLSFITLPILHGLL